MCIGLHVKYPLFSLDFNKTCIFSTNFEKILISHSIQIRPVGTELLHVDGQIDITKVLVAFRSFANVPKETRITNFF